MKCVLRVGSSQHLPRIMRAWGRMRNFIISKRIWRMLYNIIVLFTIKALKNFLPLLKSFIASVLKHKADISFNTQCYYLFLSDKSLLM